MARLEARRPSLKFILRSGNTQQIEGMDRRSVAGAMLGAMWASTAAGAQVKIPRLAAPRTRTGPVAPPQRRPQMARIIRRFLDQIPGAKPIHARKVGRMVHLRYRVDNRIDEVFLPLR
jgi:hypothetical protein